MEHIVELVTFGKPTDEHPEGDIRWPEGGTDVYGFRVDPEARTFTPWEVIMDEFVYDPTMPFFNILVPTMDTTRVRYIVKTLVRVAAL